ncbi:MAG: cysteine desulfurase family protein [Eubacteriales bacterium]
MEVYLDNSATTRCYKSVCDIVGNVMFEDYGNPSSVHKKGLEAERYIRKSKEVFARILKVQEKELFFTSGGTESDNLALIGIAKANQRAGNHLITTAIEHPAILNTMFYLEEEGFRVTYLPVDESGRIRMNDLKEALCKDTILVSIMHVNNEIGSVQPIEEAARVIKSFNRNIVFHVDAVQGFGKYRLFPKRIGVDAMSISGHKIHGPKGTGVLYVDQKVKIKPIIFGGEQQRNIRSGTENVPGIAGIGVAAAEIYHDFDRKIEGMRELKSYFIKEIQKIEDIVINSVEGQDGAPHIISVSFGNVRSEVLLHALEEKGIYVSAGSACASNHPGISSVLRSIGLEKQYLESTIRFSLSEFTTKEEIDYTLETLYNSIPMLRRYTRR